MQLFQQLTKTRNKRAWETSLISPIFKHANKREEVSKQQRTADRNQPLLFLNQLHERMGNQALTQKLRMSRVFISKIKGF
jgi:hypothetical protein